MVANKKKLNKQTIRQNNSSSDRRLN